MSVKNLYDVAVVVPVYKPDMTCDEMISFQQCQRILSNYCIILVAPQGMDVEKYQIASEKPLIVERFSSVFFRDIPGYNRLMLSSQFYRRFTNFRCILIYQLDAFVFSDQLSEWCCQNYDYIGAPWQWSPELEQAARRSSRIRQSFPFIGKRLNQYVGNGGLSLRNVNASLWTLKLCARKAKRWTWNEDYFWAFHATSYNPFFKVPKPQTAFQFSFETQPSEAYEQNGRVLPFGCHAWGKYDRDFWHPFFLEHGYVI